MDEIPHDTIQSAQNVADTLEQRGHAAHAGALRAALAKTRPGTLLLATLRETCQIVLTAIEAIDPVSATLVEELRLEVNKRLAEHTVQRPAVNTIS